MRLRPRALQVPVRTPTTGTEQVLDCNLTVELLERLDFMVKMSVTNDTWHSRLGGRGGGRPGAAERLGLRLLMAGRIESLPRLN